MSKPVRVRQPNRNEDSSAEEETEATSRIPRTTVSGQMSSRPDYSSGPIRHKARHDPSPSRDRSSQRRHATADALEDAIDSSTSYVRSQPRYRLDSLSQRAPGLSIRPQQVSGLSAVALNFLDSVPLRAVEKAGRYIFRNPRAVEEEDFERRYSIEACNAMVKDDQTRAMNCIEKLVMTRHCSNLSEKDTMRYFQTLVRNERPLAEKFDADFQKYWGACVDTAEYQSRRESQTQSQSIPRRDTANPVDALSRKLAQADIGVPPAAGATRRHASRDIDDDLGDRHGLRSRIQRDDNDDSDDDDGVRYGLGHRRGLQQSASAANRFDPHGTAQPVRHVDLPSEVSEASFQGSKGEEERLDKRFYRRSPQVARQTLKVGRMFAVLRHSEVTGDDMGQLKWRSRTKQDVEVFSHICRMIVVKECHGFVWAIPVNTYSGKGVGKRGFNQTDTDAHAIVYTPNQKPSNIAHEPRMRKNPIKVIPVSSSETLDAASRINFSKPHSIDHNVKFLDIGKVAPESMPYLTTYFKQYL